MLLLKNIRQKFPLYKDSMQRHEQGGIKLYCLEKMQAKRKGKKEWGLYDKMLWTKFKVEFDCKILCSQLWQADFAVLRP